VAVVDFAPQLADLDIHHIGEGVGAEPPDLLQDAGAAQHLAPHPQEAFQQGEFLCREVDL